MRSPSKYFILAVIFWVVVDYSTAFNPDWQRWIEHMPLILLFYLGYPLLFTFLIYRLKWRRWQLFLAVLFMTFFLEMVIFHNTLLTTFPMLLVMIPVAVAIYSFITYVPLWIAEGNLRNKWKLSSLLTLVWLIVSILNYKSTISG